MQFELLLFLTYKRTPIKYVKYCYYQARARRVNNNEK